MIYSRWRPNTGGYDYFQANGDIPLANDLPIPSLPSGTKIGVASVDVGRRIPSAAKYVGSGEKAKGMVSPISQSSLGLGSVTTIMSAPFLWFAGGMLAVIGIRRFR